MIESLYYNDGHVKVRKSIIEDIDFLADRLRIEDINEVWASDHMSPRAALEQSFNESSHCFTIENGMPIAMFGISPENLLGTDAVIWFLSSDDIEKIKYRFLKCSKFFIDTLLDVYPVLYNYVDFRNKKSIDWLYHCGATIFEPKEYGLDRRLFCEFYFSKNQVAKTDSIRTKIDKLQNVMKEFPGAKIGDSDLCPLKHTFCEGSYVREIFMPKGTLVVSKIHKKRHPYFIMSGEVSVVTEKGTERIKAPYHGITEPGTKRALLVHEDTVWITVHATEETDLEKIENDIIAKSFDEIECLRENEFLLKSGGKE